MSHSGYDRLLMGSPLRRRGPCMVISTALSLVLAFAALVHLSLFAGMRPDVAGVFFLALVLSSMLAAVPLAVLWFLDRRERETLLAHDVPCYPPFDAQQAEQQVLGADVIMQADVGLFGGVLQNVLRVCAERDLDGGCERRLTWSGSFVSQQPESVRGDGSGRQELCDEQVLVFQESQQQIVRLDCPVAEHAGLVTGEQQRTPGLLVIPLKHSAVHDMTEGRCLPAIMR